MYVLCCQPHHVLPQGSLYLLLLRHVSSFAFLTEFLRLSASLPIWIKLRAFIWPTLFGGSWSNSILLTRYTIYDPDFFAQAMYRMVLHHYFLYVPWYVTSVHSSSFFLVSLRSSTLVMISVLCIDLIVSAVMSTFPASSFVVLLDESLVSFMFTVSTFCWMSSILRALFMLWLGTIWVCLID